MSEKKVANPVALAVGAALAGSFALTGTVASADTVESPFAFSKAFKRHAGVSPRTFRLDARKE